MKKILLFVLILLSFPPISALSQVSRDLSKVQKSEFFIENKGQWDSQAKYLARINGLNFWITGSGIVYDYYRLERDSIKSLENGLPNDGFRQIKRSWGQTIKSSVLNISPTSHLISEDKKEAYYNYFLGNDSAKWASDVPLYSFVTMKNAYEGIDIAYYFDEGTVRYDFILNSGANPNQIKLKFEGQNTLSINPNGDLELGTSLGVVEHNKLYAYQNTSTGKLQIECKFQDLGNGEIAFSLGNYDKTKSLIIDPLVYCTYLGSTGADYILSVTADNSGNSIVAGITATSNFPTTTGAWDKTLSLQDGFISKFNSDASNLAFSTFLGGSSNEMIFDIKLDNNNSIFVGGSTFSSDFPTTSGCFKSTYSGNGDGFVTKLNSTGSNLLFSTYIGGSNRDEVYSLAINSNGNSFVTGETFSSNFPTTIGSYQEFFHGMYNDAFILKLNISGTALVYSTFFGGSGGEYSFCLGFDSNDNAIITGETDSQDLPTTINCFDSTNGDTDGFLTKINADGSALLFSTYLGGNKYDYGYCLAVDSKDNIFTLGTTSSNDFPITSDAFKSTCTWEGMYISKFSETGDMIYSSYFGGNGGQRFNGLTLDENDNIFISGATNANDFPVTSDAFQSSKKNGTDLFISKFSSDFSKLLYSSYFGGNGTEDFNYNQEKCLAWDHWGNIIIATSSNSTDLPVSTNAYQKNLSGNMDGFVAKFSILTIDIEINDFVPNPICLGDSLFVSYKILSGSVNTDNIFQVELSDEYGNFDLPKVIGSKTSTTSGTISCFIPKNGITPASGYFLRIVSSSPKYIGRDNKTKLTIYPLPKIQYIKGDSVYCEGTNGTEIGLDGSENSVSYQLYYDNSPLGNPVSGTGKTITFGKQNQIGKYKVLAISSNGCKNWMNGEINLQVIPLPEVYDVTGGGPIYNQKGPGTYCEGDIGVAMGLSMSDTTAIYQIKLNGKNFGLLFSGTGSALNFGIIYKEGTYTVEAITKLANCPRMMNDSIVVRIIPAPADYSLFSKGTFCDGSSGTDIMLLKSDSSVSYQLFLDGMKIGKPLFGNGDTLNFGKYNQSGKFTVLATDTTTGCSKLMSDTVSLTPLPIPTPYEVTGTRVFCFGKDAAVIKLSNSEKNVVYEIFKDDEPLGISMQGTGQPMEFDPLISDGLYSIWAKSDDNGCESKMEGSVSVSNPQSKDTVILGNRNPAMLSTEIYSIKSIEQNETDSWEISGGTVIGSKTGKEVKIKWNSEKLGIIKLKRTNNDGCKVTEILEIKLFNMLVPDFTADVTKGEAPLTVNFTNNSSGIISKYIWEFGDNNSSPQENASHTYKLDGTYSVKLTIGYEGEEKSIEKTNYITVGPNSITEKESKYPTLFPNPTTDKLTLSNIPDGTESYEIFDIFGERVLSTPSLRDTPQEGNWEIDVSSLPTGVYFLKLNNQPPVKFIKL